MNKTKYPNTISVIQSRQDLRDTQLNEKETDVTMMKVKLSFTCNYKVTKTEKYFLGYGIQIRTWLRK